MSSVSDVTEFVDLLIDFIASDELMVYAIMF